MLASQRPANCCVLYVLGQKDGRYLKIGKTRNPIELRIAQHEARGPEICQMQPLALLWGHDSDEKFLKRRWKHLRSERGDEWLIPESKELREWVRFLRQQSFVARTVEELDVMAYVDSRHWLPSHKNSIAVAQTKFRFDNDPWGDLDIDEVMDGDFYTHPIIIAAARQAMGGIDLDPASCREANSIVKATRFFGVQEDGLGQRWEGRVWLNPPFNQWDFWAPKVISELQSGRIEQLCLLCPSRASTAKNFHSLAKASSSVMIPNGRFKFWGPKATSGPDEGHLIFYFGANTANFAFAFQTIGTVFVSTMDSAADAGKSWREMWSPKFGLTASEKKEVGP